MKRSQINALMRQAVAFFDRHSFRLPPFAFWSPSDWRTRGEEADELRRCRLGWDLTDFGSGRFEQIGLLLFTLRNGDPQDIAGTRPYAEKIMIVQVGQVTPWHFHGAKQEDIINRGGGKLAIELSNANEVRFRSEGFGKPLRQELSDTQVRVSIDGVQRLVAPRGKVVLSPGESITLYQGLAHTFYAEEDRVLVGEVSSVNDDQTDNYFIQPVGRFPEIEEDEPPLYLLCNEYPPAAGPRNG
jgi:D-lyxose ketol-isomerase